MSIIFSKSILGDGKLDYLKFADDFSISDDINQIIFGFNGIGKTSIYEYLKENFPRDYVFFDYKERPTFTSSGKKIELTVNTDKIITSQGKIVDLKNQLSLKKNMKQLSITKKADVDKLRIEGLSNSYKSDVFDYQKPSNKTTDVIKKYVSVDECAALLRDRSEFLKISNIRQEIRDYSESYLLKVFDDLENHYDDSKLQCPVCGSTINIPFSQIVATKKKELGKLADMVLSHYRSFRNIGIEHQEEAIAELVTAIKELEENEYVTLCIAGLDKTKMDDLVSQCNELNKEEKTLSNLEKERKSYYRQMSTDKDFVKRSFEKIYTESTVIFDDTKNVVNIELPRDSQTYSVGEQNEMCLFIRALGFLGSEQKTMILDDPLSSYDFVHQYRMIFWLIKACNNSRKIIAFTHNLDTIRIIKSQVKVKNKFDFEYIEQDYDGVLHIQKIDQDVSDYSLYDLIKISTLIGLNVLRDENFIRNNESDGNQLFEDNKFDGDKVFHYDDEFKFKPNNKYEVQFKNLSNVNLVQLIDEKPIPTFDSSKTFMENISLKIEYLFAVRVWIEKQLYDYLKSPGHEHAFDEYHKSTSTFERINIASKEPDFKSYFPNYIKENVMIKKAMLNEESHYRGQTIPFNFAMNISFHDLYEEIDDIKKSFAH